MNKPLVKFAIASVVTAGFAMASSSALAAKNNQMEKCYGIAKAGKNACGGPGTGHACQGQGKKNANVHDWLMVPKGLCDSIIGGGTTAESAKTAQEELKKDICE